MKAKKPYWTREEVIFSERIADYKFEMWNDEYCIGMSRGLYQYMPENHMTYLAYSSQCKGYFQKFVKSEPKGLIIFLNRVKTERNLNRAYSCVGLFW